LLGGFDTVLSKFTIVAYNGGALDIPFFKEFFKQNDSEKLFFSMFYNQFIDPMNNLHESTLIEGSRSTISSLSLKGAAKFLGVPFDESKLHGALYDTKILREVKLAYDEKYTII
jgi:DNA polymerase III epsilon subunit-like protein